MFNLVIADVARLWSLDLWYAVPAIIAVSLVYAATRHEQMRPILVHAGRVAVWMTAFMFIVLVVVQLISWQV